MWKWLDFRGRRYARERAAVASTAGPTLNVITGFVRCWGLNWEDGSRESHQRDLEHLIWLAHAARSGGADQVRCDALVEAVQAVHTLIADDSSYRFDKRMMTPEAAVRFVHEVDRLHAARRGLCE